MTTASFIVRIALNVLAFVCSVRWTLPKSAPGWLGRRWCSCFHDKPMWPIHRRYRCLTCHRETPVRWEKEIA